MLRKLFERKEDMLYVPPVLGNLSEIQRRHYIKFRQSLSWSFLLSKDVEKPSDDILCIGISDGYLSSVRVGEIRTDGSVCLKYPEIQSIIDLGSFREVLNGTLNLREALQKKRIKYEEGVDKKRYCREIENRFGNDILDLSSRV